MPLKTLFKIIRARSDIDNSKFNILKEFGLEHCFVNGGKTVKTMLYLIFTASNIEAIVLI